MFFLLFCVMVGCGGDCFVVWGIMGGFGCFGCGCLSLSEWFFDFGGCGLELLCDLFGE